MTQQHEQEQRRRVLVADDDQSIRQLVSTIVRRESFTVDAAADGLEAIELLKKHEYAVVLLDLMMPRMSGYEFLEQLETWPESERPVVVVLTAGTEPRDLNPKIVAGTIRKPFDLELLIDAISGCMRSLEMTSADSELDRISGKPN